MDVASLSVVHPLHCILPVTMYTYPLLYKLRQHDNYESTEE
jgi:hypothetical protein